MKPVQFEQPIYEDPTFPLVFHEDYLSFSRRSIYANWHTGIEVLRFRTGSVHIILDADRVDYASNDLAVIDSSVIHSIVADSKNCVYDCLIVDKGFLRNTGFPVERAISPRVQDARANGFMDRIRQEFATGQPLYKQAVLAEVLGLFALLYRTHPVREAASGDRDSSRAHLAVVSALSFIHSNLSGDLSVDAIADHVAVSKYYFCRLFRAYTDTSVMHYVNRLRCTHARQLMLVKGYTVSQAAREMNIGNLSYFSRLYRRHMGILPSEEIAGKAPAARPGGTPSLR